MIALFVLRKSGRAMSVFTRASDFSLRQIIICRARLVFGGSFDRVFDWHRSKNQPAKHPGKFGSVPSRLALFSLSAALFLT